MTSAERVSFYPSSAASGWMEWHSARERRCNGRASGGRYDRSPWVTKQRSTTALGPNAWLVDEMYEQYLADPSSVSESWQEFFADYKRETDHATATAPRPTPAPPRRPDARARHRRPRPRRAGPRAAPARPPAPAAATAPAPPRRPAKAAPTADDAGRAPPGRRRPHRRQHGGEPRGPHGHQLPGGPGQAARGQPPGHQRLPGPHPRRQGQLHPPHRLRRRPGHRRDRAGHELDLRRGRDGKPRVVRHEHVGLGLAVDVEKSDGSRTLLVPGHQGRRHARLPRLLGRLRGPHPQGPHQQAQPRRLRRRHRHASPTRARSAPSSRCPGSCPARA